MKFYAAVLAAFIALGTSGTQAQYRGGGDRAGDFDFYVLALSWSPSYCESKGDRADRMQCGGPKPFAFVTHGLWPQYERGFPSDCRVTGRAPTRAQVDGLLDIMPSPGLVRYQWRKHGSCSGLNPPDYFRTVRAAYDKVSIPQDFQLAERDRDISRLMLSALSWTPIRS